MNENAYVFKKNLNCTMVYTMDGDGDEKYLGVISELEDCWKWIRTDPINLLESVRNVSLPSKEIAAEFLLAVKHSHDEHVKSNPLPSDIVVYLEREADNLRDREKRLLSEFMDVRIKKSMLNRFSKEYNLREVVWRVDHTDIEELVKEIYDFKIGITDDDKDVYVPFFSETALYNLIGKEDARTILSLFGRLCQSVAPNIAP